MMITVIDNSNNDIIIIIVIIIIMITEIRVNTIISITNNYYHY